MEDRYHGTQKVWQLWYPNKWAFEQRQKPTNVILLNSFPADRRHDGMVDIINKGFQLHQQKKHTRI